MLCREAADSVHIAAVLEKQHKSMKDLIQDIAREVRAASSQVKCLLIFFLVKEYAQMQAFQGLQLEKDTVYVNIRNHVCLCHS